MEIESSQLGKGIALKKMVTLCLDEAVNILLLRQERKGENGYPAKYCFDSEQEQCLTMLNRQVEGNTQKQKNPYSANSLAWAVWIIARLAGWLPNDMDKRPPGVITIARGLKIFHQQYLGFQAALQFLNPPIQNSS